MARRAVLRKAYCLAFEIGDRTDRRLGLHVPVEIGRADHLAANDTDRRAFGERAKRSRHPDADGAIHATGDHRLDRFRAALGVEELEREAVLLEDAATL